MVSDQVHPGRQRLQTVLLRHTLPDGTWHYDWMLELHLGGELATFRVGVRIDDPATGGFDAERIGDHRRAYLEYQGAIGGGRGMVERVAAGDLTVIRSLDSEIEAIVSFGGVARHVRGRLIDGGAWRFDPTQPAAAR